MCVCVSVCVAGRVSGRERQGNLSVSGGTGGGGVDGAGTGLAEAMLR